MSQKRPKRKGSLRDTSYRPQEPEQDDNQQPDAGNSELTDDQNDTPVSLHPLSFFEAIKLAVETKVREESEEDSEG